MPYVPGARAHGVAHISDVYKSNNVFVNNVPVALWDQAGATSAVVDGQYISDNPYRDAFASPLIESAGTNAPNDDPDSPSVEYSPVGSEPTPLTTTTTYTESGVNTIGNPVSCGDFMVNPIDYNQQLSANFTIKNLSTDALFPHNIVAQNGLTVPDIICNLKALSENILEPLKSQYPGFRINSGFRKGDGVSSQHNKGQAVDLQWPSLSLSGYTPIAIWMRNNLPFDQLIFEHGNSIWIHVSYDRLKNTQRGQVLTYFQGNYNSGLTNHYA